MSSSDQLKYNAQAIAYDLQVVNFRKAQFHAKGLCRALWQLIFTLETLFSFLIGSIIGLSFALSF